MAHPKQLSRANSTKSSPEYQGRAHHWSTFPFSVKMEKNGNYSNFFNLKNVENGGRGVFVRAPIFCCQHYAAAHPLTAIIFIILQLFHRDDYTPNYEQIHSIFTHTKTQDYTFPWTSINENFFNLFFTSNVFLGIIYTFQCVNNGVILELHT